METSRPRFYLNSAVFFGLALVMEGCAAGGNLSGPGNAGSPGTSPVAAPEITRPDPPRKEPPLFPEGDSRIKLQSASVVPDEIGAESAEIKINYTSDLKLAEMKQVVLVAEIEAKDQDSRRVTTKYFHYDGGPPLKISPEQITFSFDNVRPEYERGFGDPETEQKFGGPGTIHVYLSELNPGNSEFEYRGRISNVLDIYVVFKPLPTR